MSFKPDPTETRKLLAAAREASRHLPIGLPPIIYLTDPDRSSNPVRTARQLPSGSAVIYRHFGESDKVAIAGALRQATWQSRCRLLIGNDPALAMRVRADGLHWSEGRMRESKYWRRRFALITAAAHSPMAISRAAKEGVDAVVLSTVFPSSSLSASSAMGARRFRAIANRSPLPVYALGGLQAQNAGQITGTAGIASISGIEKAFGA